MTDIAAEIRRAGPTARRADSPSATTSGESLRVRLSWLRALILTGIGKPRGFFVQYPYARDVAAVSEPYPEIESLCEASPWREFLTEMARHRQTLETFISGHGARLGRGMFPALDGISTYVAVRKFRPQKIIEIGSGNSTYFLAAGVRDNGSGHITCIDPQPRQDIIELDVEFKSRLLNNSDTGLAGSLDPGDILFIDSSHIMFPGMDVDIQMNRLFPRLKSGVIVHIHDIFLPDDYPPSWRQRHYSEQNALVGWLASGFFEILWPGQYVITRHFESVTQTLGGLGDLSRGGSLWLRKT